MLFTDNAEKNSQYYDDIYAQGYNTTRYYPLYSHIMDSIKKIEKPRVLEIGCGVGDLGKMTIDEGIAYRGFDFSEEAVNCSQRLCPDGDFQVGDAYEEKCYLPHDYNIAVALEVLEHVDDLRVIKNIPPGVHLLASVPDYNDVAHLRIYQDPQRDIIDRFKPLLDIVEIVPMVSENKASGHKMTVYVFHAVRKNPASKLILSGAMTETKIGRNDPCPCGSGKKYKKCCGKK